MLVYVIDDVTHARLDRLPPRAPQLVQEFSVPRSFELGERRRARP